MRARLVILASGNGSLAQSMIDATKTGVLNADVVAVISDRADAHVLARAEKAGIQTHLLEMTADRSEWNARLIELLTSLEADLIIRRPIK